MSSYLRQASTWSSVTPVILPGFDDGKYEKAERLLIKAVQQASLPVEAIKNVVLRKTAILARVAASSILSSTGLSSRFIGLACQYPS